MKLVFFVILNFTVAVSDSSVCFSRTDFNDDCVRNAILLFSEVNERKSNYMMAREINNMLQSTYVDTADNSVVIGEAWRVDIPNMADATVKTNKSAVCIKGAKSVSKSLYNNPRWTLMPNFDLCQYYPTAAQCGKYMEISLKKLCRCGTGKAIVARRGAGFVFKSYMKQYRGRQWDIYAFCDGFGC